MIRLSFLLFFFALTSPETFIAKVIGVVDGDTIVILTSEKKQVRVRLEGIDCPESRQDYGSRAKQATVDMCFGKEVWIEKTGEDRYGRTLAFVYIGERCVNKELLMLGMAWHYKYFNEDKEMAELEASAREEKIGLWSQPSPIAPWDWRRK